MGWISPTSYFDPLGGWTNETNAYDNDLGTYASGGSGKYISLSVAADIKTYKIRIYCSLTTGDDVPNVRVYNGRWTLWFGTIPALTWVEIEFNSLIEIQDIYLLRVAGSWRIYEFQFWDGIDGYVSPALEDYIVENENVITDALENPQQRNLVVGPDGRIHCVFRKCLLRKYKWLVYYAYSDDYGKTWTVEDPAPGLMTYNQHNPSIAVDSSGNPHIVFHDKPDHDWGLVDHGRYVRRSADGTWTLSDFYVGIVVRTGGGDPFNFEVEDIITGLTSGVEKKIRFLFDGGAWVYMSLYSSAAGLIEGETVVSGANRGKYFYQEGPEKTTSIVIDAEDRLRIVGEANDQLFYWVQPSPNAPFRHFQGHFGSGQNITVDLNPNNSLKTVYIDGNSYYDGFNDHLICTGTFPSAYLYANFSIASDADGFVHLVLAQTGLGGDFPGVLNIKYYKGHSGAWATSPIHITDMDYIQRCPSVSIDTQGRTHVMWQGRGWGTYPDKYSVLMKTYEDGAWGDTQIILNEDKDQGAFGASLLHAWYPNSNRLRAPIYVFNRQGSWKIQFGGELHAGRPPDGLLCEQTENPTNVSDPKPEFSAIYRG